MNLHTQPSSVLTHGGDSESAISSTIKTAHEHHAVQTGAIGVEVGNSDEKSMALHKCGQQKVVTNAADYDEAVADGWSETPDEIVAKDAPNNGYVVAGHPSPVKGESPHPRHMHYEEQAEAPEGEE